MTISYGPYAFDSPFITWAGLFMIAGIIVGGALFARAIARQDVSRHETCSIVLFSVFGGLIGARLFHIVDYLGFFTDAPFHIIYLWEGGYSLWGGVLGGLAVGLCKTGRAGLFRPSMADAAVVPSLVGLTIGRLGGIIGGDPPATESSVPWAIVYDHPDSFAFAAGAAVHPVAAYEMLLSAAIALCMLCCGRRLPQEATMPLALAAWAAGRFVIAFVRLDPVTFGLQQAQWVGLVVIAVVALWAWRSGLWQRLRARGGDGPTAHSP